MDNESSVAERIESLLDQEEGALKQIDFDKMIDLSAQKEAMLEELQTVGMTLDPVTVLRLRNKAHSNQGLHAATIGGLKSAIDRLKAGLRASQHLDTYTASGRLRDLAEPKSTLEKKA
ncbi:MAG: hypothetical protein ACJA1E_000150 [Paracoccaceae bacterium]|jgi:hypothetical protein